MSQSSVGLSARSLLIAGVSAAIVGTAVVNPVTVPEVNPAKIAAAFEMTSVTTSLENGIKNTYDFVEPWVAWGFELTQYVLSFIPGVWWLAPAIDLGYFTIEPLVQSGVYTFADVVGLNFGQIWPDITAGVSQSISNAVDYALAWLGSLVPLPPFPPFPPRPFAASSAESVLPAAAAGLSAAPTANSITTPIENAIKNSYDFVEGWANYGMQWADYALGRIPVVNWFTPAIPLVYNTIEPLVQGGVYALADLIGFNWNAIGPDIWNGIKTSVNNAIQGVINWINIPLPPVPPIRSAASVTAGATSLRAAAAVKPAEATTETGVEVSTPAAETPAGDKTDKTDKTESATPAVEAPAVAVDAPAAAEDPKPARTGRRGHSTPVSAAATDDAGAGSTVKTERPGRTGRAHSHAG